MASLVKDEPQVAEYFRDAVLEIVDPNVLKQVVDELDASNSASSAPTSRATSSNTCSPTSDQAALNGQFRTPRQIRAFMVEMVDPDLGDTIFDPACGTGGFLIDAVDYLLAKYSETPQEAPIYGEDWLEKARPAPSPRRRRRSRSCRPTARARAKRSPTGAARSARSTASTSRAR